MKDNIIISNLGFFVTREVIYNNTKKSTEWNFEKRYSSKFKIPKGLSSCIGFFHMNNERIRISSFKEFNRAMVAVTQNNIIEILPDIRIKNYKFKFGDGKTINLDKLNTTKFSNNKTYLTLPDILTPKIKHLEKEIIHTIWETDKWKNYYEVIKNGMYNIFIANIGNGFCPENFVLQIWEDEFPIMPFGAVISIPKKTYECLFGNLNGFRKRFLNKKS